MTILLLNKNLLWNVRLRKALSSAGHTVILPSSSETLPKADAAIINLYDYIHELEPLVRKLKNQNTFILAHAGHKDQELWKQAIRAGCHQVVSNGEIFARPNHILNVLECSTKKET